MALATELNLLDAAWPNRVTAAMHTTAIERDEQRVLDQGRAPIGIGEPGLQPGLGEQVGSGHGSLPPREIRTVPIRSSPFRIA